MQFFLIIRIVIMFKENGIADIVEVMNTVIMRSILTQDTINLFSSYLFLKSKKVPNHGSKRIQRSPKKKTEFNGVDIKLTYK
jgi:hypothetical protein